MYFVIIILEAEEFNPDQPVPILENVWDAFKNYQASKEKLDQVGQPASAEAAVESIEAALPSTSFNPMPKNNEEVSAVIMMDHDYCAAVPEPAPVVDEIVEKPDCTMVEASQSMDHDYCTTGATEVSYKLFLF